jgi:hypothetical protein
MSMKTESLNLYLSSLRAIKRRTLLSATAGEIDMKTKYQKPRKKILGIEEEQSPPPVYQGLFKTPLL